MLRRSPRRLPLARLAAFSFLFPFLVSFLSSDSLGSSDSIREQFEAYARRLIDGGNKWFGERAKHQLEKMLDEPSMSLRTEALVRLDLSFELLKLGETQEAIVVIEKALAIARKEPSLRRNLATFLGRRAVCWLREAEIENCIRRHNADCCVFPLQGGGVHEVREPALEARRSLKELLELNPRDSDARWLFNITAMALGEYPEGVSEEYLIPERSLASTVEAPLFADVAPQLGVDDRNLCGGAITDDFDNDGDLDLVASTFDPLGELAFYRNLGDGSFRDDKKALGLSNQLGGLNCIAGDYDDDGDLDILVLRGAWLQDDGQIRNSLLRNDGEKGFTDVTEEAGLALPARPTQSAAWGDFDNDGHLDLYVVNESRLEIDGRGDYPAQLFHNQGDGTFQDVAKQAGVLNDRYAKGVSVGDYDNDGDLDIYISNAGRNRLYRNEGDLKFVDVAPRASVAGPTGRSFATWFFDYDNDGWLDIFVAGYDATLTDLVSDALGKAHGASAACLYRNKRDGTFENIAPEVGLGGAYLPMGANFGDVNGDGWLDIYLATGGPSFSYLMPNVLLMNVEGRRFANATTVARLGHLQKGHGVAFGDIDNDGDLDLFHQLGGFYPSDSFPNSLFINRGPSQGRMVVVELRGEASNHYGVGARIDVFVETAKGEPKRIHRAVGSVSSFGGSPHRVEIGVGKAESIDMLEVTWPSGTVDRYRNLPVGGRIIIHEGREVPETSTSQRIDLEGSV